MGRNFLWTTIEIVNVLSMMFGVSILSLLSFTIIIVLSVEKNLIHASSAVNVTNAIYVWTVMIGSRFK